MEDVKFILRAVSIVIGIGAYLAGWVLYVKICRNDMHCDSGGAVFYAVWTMVHLMAAVIGFIWAWL